MGALELRKLAGASIESDTCCGDRCTRKGRYALEVLGYPVLSTQPMYRGHVETYCGGCAEKLKRTWRRYSGESALTLLEGSAADRVDGVSELRDLGYSKRVASEAAKRVAA